MHRTGKTEAIRLSGNDARNHEAGSCSIPGCVQPLSIRCHNQLLPWLRLACVGRYNCMRCAMLACQLRSHLVVGAPPKGQHHSASFLLPLAGCRPCRRLRSLGSCCLCRVVARCCCVCHSTAGAGRAAGPGAGAGYMQAAAMCCCRHIWSDQVQVNAQLPGQQAAKLQQQRPLIQLFLRPQQVQHKPAPGQQPRQLLQRRLNANRNSTGAAAAAGAVGCIGNAAAATRLQLTCTAAATLQRQQLPVHPKHS